MNVLFNVFFKTLGFFFAVFLIFLLTIGFTSYLNEKSDNNFQLIRGDKESKNTIFILEINGPIIENESSINDFIKLNIISPSDVQIILNKISKINPNFLIISINSPGGTVSASNELYDMFRTFKKNYEIKTIFHTSELLASGGYWSSLSGDNIYASYGSIIGSIGVKGPDWFYYNKPKLISSGLLGQTIEVTKEIEIYSTSSGSSKDLFNSFRKPTKKELDHLNAMVKKINDDFVQLVSKKRKIEKKIIRDEIGGLIFNSSQAKNNFLIDGEISLDQLVTKLAKENEFTDYKVIKNYSQKNSFLDKLLSTVYANKTNLNICRRIKTNMVSLLSYSSVGC